MNELLPPIKHVVEKDTWGSILSKRAAFWISEEKTTEDEWYHIHIPHETKYGLEEVVIVIEKNAKWYIKKNVKNYYL